MFVTVKKEEKEVLKKLEKQGKKWRDGKKPTKLNYFSSYYREYAIIVDGSVIYYTANAIMSIASIPYYKNAKKISAAEFLKENKETIVIYRNGAETMALEKNTGRKAVAKCHADDTYSFEIGAKLALERLFPETVPEEKPQRYYNGKVVCVEACPLTLVFTKGKIYEFKEGYVIGDTGTKNKTQMRNFEDIERTFDSKFIELVE